MIAEDFLGIARVSRVGDGVLAIADFSLQRAPNKDCFGEAPKPAREARALPEPKNARHN
jgi:hypothetical protein